MNVENIYIVDAGQEKCRPGHTYGPHIRGYYLVHYVLNGGGTFIMGNKRHEVKKGDCFVIFPTSICMYEANTEDPWEYVWIGFIGNNAPSLLNRCGINDSGVYSFSDSQKNRLDNFLNGALPFVFDMNDSSQLCFLGALYLMLPNIIAPPKPTASVYAERIAEYIRLNFSGDISVTKLASFIGLDRSYMCRIFKQHQKVTPQEYIINYRLTKAIEYINENRLNITEIAHSCGFNDLSHFSFLFKKRMRLSPKQYMSQHKQTSAPVLLSD